MLDMSGLVVEAAKVEGDGKLVGDVGDEGG